MTTTRRKITSLLTSAAVLSFGAAALLPYADPLIPLKNVHFSRLSPLFAAAGLIWLLIRVIAWCVAHQPYKGIRRAFLHAKTQHLLETAFLNAQIYIQKPEAGSQIVRLPRVFVKYDKSCRYGQVIVENALRLDKSLDELPIQSALPGDFIVTACYQSDDGNFYIYETETCIGNPLVFHHHKDFEEYCRGIDAYDLFVDSRHVHHLFHMLIVGQTGSGKTYLIYMLILQMLYKEIEYEIYFADPKRSDVFVLGSIVAPKRTAADPRDIVALLEDFYSAFLARQNEFAPLLNHNIGSTYTKYGLSPIVMVIDEFSAFDASCKTMPKQTRDRVSEILGAVVREGRQLGCFLIIAQQQTNAANLPTELKENIPWKIALGKAENQTYITLWGEKPEVAKRRFDRGQGLMSYPPDVLPDNPAIIQVPTLDFDIQTAFEDAVKTVVLERPGCCKDPGPTSTYHQKPLH